MDDNKIVAFENELTYENSLESANDHNYINQIIEKTTTNKYTILIFIILAFAYMSEGGEMVVISIILNKLQVKWELSEKEKGLIGSFIQFGVLVGTLTGGYLSDKIGRKKTLIIGSLVVSIFSIISPFTNSYFLFVFIRTCYSCGLGITLPSSSNLLTEMTPQKNRLILLTFVWIFYPIGQIFILCINYNVTEYDNDWRIILFLASLPSFFSFIFIFFMIESPRYYFIKGKMEDCYDTIDKLLLSENKESLNADEKNMILENYNKEKVNKSMTELEIVEVNNKNDNLNVENKNVVENVNDKDIKSIKNDKTTLHTKFTSGGSLFSQDYFGLTIRIAMIFYFVSFVYGGLLFILPQTLEKIAIENEISSNKLNSSYFVGEHFNNTIFDSNLNSTKLNVTNSTGLNSPNGDLRMDLKMLMDLIFSSISEIPSNFISLIMANSILFGRKMTIMYGFLFSILFAILSIYSTTILPYSAGLLRMTISVSYNVIIVYVSEAYPTTLRSKSISFTYSFAKIANILTPLLIQYTFSVNRVYPFYGFCAISFLGTFISYTLPLETLGKDMKNFH